MSVATNKVARLAAGGRPRVMDVFAGCGGLSLGFAAAGCDVYSAVEFDSLAALTHATNFHKNLNGEAFELHSRARDIIDTEPIALLEQQYPGSDAVRAIDILIGGPPCQAFARVGRAKLREVDEHPQAFAMDPRGNLYLRYLHYVRELEPLAILMENVPDALNWGGHNIAEEVSEVLDGLGYITRYTLLNSALYGVPQMRERMLLIAYRTELGIEPRFPVATHYVDLPAGYGGTRAVALKHIQAGLLFTHHYEAAPPSGTGLRPAVTAEGALDDLPPITKHLNGEMPRGTRRFTSRAEYREDFEPNAFMLAMRQWPSFESPGWVTDHVIRSLPRDYPIFRAMEPGDQYPEAHKVAIRLFETRKAELIRTMQLDPSDTQAVDNLRASMVPPYDVGKFPNKWRKMEADAPARTLMAHLGKDSYSHIHYDSRQARTISVREAARLQSFPDGFSFCGTMNPAFRQIGNAVPPLLAKSLGERMAADLQEATRALHPEGPDSAQREAVVFA
jgi:DNA (cytosine-5)-methyltransferase 1